MHRFNGPSVHIHNIALHCFVFAPALSIERFFLCSHETSRAGTVMSASGCHVVTVVFIWSTVSSGMLEITVDVALCDILNAIHCAFFVAHIHTLWIYVMFYGLNNFLMFTELFIRSMVFCSSVCSLQLKVATKRLSDLTTYIAVHIAHRNCFLLRLT